MKKKPAIHGNSWTIYINKSWAMLLGITPNDYDIALYFKNKSLYVQSKKDLPNTNYIEKKLIKRSSGYAIILTQPLLNLLEINPEADYIDLNIEDNILIIKKAQ